MRCRTRTAASTWAISSRPSRPTSTSVRCAPGREVAFICADDMHGTPIEMSGAKAGLPPEEYVEQIHREHREDYAASRSPTTSSTRRLRGEPPAHAGDLPEAGGARLIESGAQQVEAARSLHGGRGLSRTALVPLPEHRVRGLGRGTGAARAPVRGIEVCGIRGGSSELSQLRRGLDRRPRALFGSSRAPQLPVDSCCAGVLLGVRLVNLVVGDLERPA